MDPLIAVLRAAHIGFGVFWVGGLLFMVLLLTPRLKALGPAVQGPVMQALAPITIPVFTGSGLLVIASGAAIALKLRWGTLDKFFVGDWGWVILAGAILATSGFLLGLMVSRPAMMEAVRLGASIRGRPPSAEEGARLGALQWTITWSTRSTASLLVAAVIAMAVARFV